MQHLALVSEIAQQITSVLELERLLPKAARAIQRHFPDYGISILLSDDEGKTIELWASSGYLEEIFPLHYRLTIGRGLIGSAAGEGQTILANDASQDSRYIRVFENEPLAGSELSVPLRLGKNVLGVLDLQSPKKGAFQPEDVTTFEILADQLAIAIENARLFAREQEQRRLAETLREVGIVINSALDLDTVLQLIMEHLESVVPYDVAIVLLLEGDKVSIASTRGYGSEIPPVDESLRWDIQDDPTLRAMRKNKRPCVVANVFDRPQEERPRFSGHARSWIGSPLVSQSEVIGFFYLGKKEADFYKETHAAALSGFASQAVVAIGNARLHAQTLDRVREMSALLRVNQAFVGSTDVNEVLKAVIKEAVTVAGCSEGLVVLRDFSNDMLRIVASHGIDGLDLAEANAHPIEASRGTFAISILRGEVVEIPDTGQSTLPERLLQRELPKSLSNIPLKAGVRVIGAISLNVAPLTENARRLLYAITDLAAMAIERARLFESVQRSQNLYRILFDGVPEAVYLFDPESLRILDVNKTCIARYGYTRQELLEMSVCELYLPEDVDACKASVQEILTKKSYRAPRDIRHLCRDGSTLDVSTNSTTIRLSGRPAILTIASDVTQRRKLEEQLRLAQKMESVGLLASGVAHDFNNILTVILGNASYARSQIDPDSPLLIDLKTIERTARRGADLTRRLLTFARPGKQHTTLVDINELVGEVVKILSRTLDKRIVIQQQLAEKAALVKGDPVQLQQVLMNLAVNARDAMLEGGQLTIGTEVVSLNSERVDRYLDIEPGPYVQLIVADTGIGMDSEVKSHLFNPFFTTKEPGKGTGLGLAIVFGIVKDHGGHIDIYSEPGQGTQVRVFLPASGEGSLPEQEKPLPEPVGGTETILVVDDEEGILSMTRRLLAAHGYRVLTAGDGEEALEVCKEHGDIDLIILDLIMPRMSGRETWKKLCQMGTTSKVFLSSGMWADEVVSAVLAEGAAGFIQKPFETNALLQQIRQALGGPGEKGPTSEPGS